MNKKIKTVSLSEEAIKKCEKMAEKQRRSFSQIVELLILDSK